MLPGNILPGLQGSGRLVLAGGMGSCRQGGCRYEGRQRGRHRHVLPSTGAEVDGQVGARFCGERKRSFLRGAQDDAVGVAQAQEGLTEHEALRCSHNLSSRGLGATRAGFGRENRRGGGG